MKKIILFLICLSSFVYAADEDRFRTLETLNLSLPQKQQIENISATLELIVNNSVYNLTNGSSEFNRAFLVNTRHESTSL